jgi:hypothetical protein
MLRGRPRRSAARRGKIEAWPWPVDCTLSPTVTVPSPGNASSAPSVGVPPACSSMQEMPMPRSFPRLAASRLRAFTLA